MSYEILKEHLKNHDNQIKNLTLQQLEDAIIFCDKFIDLYNEYKCKSIEEIKRRNKNDPNNLK